MQALGISDVAPDKVTGTKLVLPANIPDKAQKSDLLALLLNEMANGNLTVPSDTQAANIRLLKPDTLRQLGAVQSILYLGEHTNIASVYDVEFANGYLICALHQNADHGLDQFDCG